MIRRNYKKKIISILMMATGFTFAAGAQSLPDTSEILAKMKLANDYFMAKWPTPCSSCLTGSRPSNIWTRAVYYEGNMAYYAISGDTAALNHAIKWGTFHSWNMRNGATTTNADDQCAGQTYLELYQIDTISERAANIKSCIDIIVKSSKVSYWTWIDAIQMAMPVFAKLGEIYNDSAYFSKMYALYNYPKTTLGLYNQTDHLWWRDTTFVKASSPAGKNIYWSRGNGWVFAALVRVLAVLPKTDSHRQEYETVFTQMSAAIKNVQRTDGFWNENLADSTHFGGPELTGTGLFTYGLAWGINNGLLTRADYLQTIVSAWKAISDSAIFSTGALGYVQGTGDSPGDNGSGVTNVTPSRDMVPDFDDYGLGCVLLAGSEVALLSKNGSTKVSFQSKVKLGPIPPLIRRAGNLLFIDNVTMAFVDIALCDAMGRQLFKSRVAPAASLRINISKRGIGFLKISTAGEPLIVKCILLEPCISGK